MGNKYSINQIENKIIKQSLIIILFFLAIIKVENKNKLINYSVNLNILETFKILYLVIQLLFSYFG